MKTLPKNAKRITLKQLDKLRKQKDKTKIIKDFDAIPLFKPLTDKKGNILREKVGEHPKTGMDIYETCLVLDRQAMNKRNNLLQIERIEQREKPETIVYKKVDKINANTGKISQEVRSTRVKNENADDYIAPRIDTSLNFNATKKEIKVMERETFSHFDHKLGKKIPVYKKIWIIQEREGLDNALTGENSIPDNVKITQGKIEVLKPKPFKPNVILRKKSV